jgi:hypothetical protein
MAKRTSKPAASKPAAQPAPVQPATQVASTATKLTKRSNVAVSAVLVATTKAPKSRAQHVIDAWAAVVAALPATASDLAKLPELAHPACVSPQAYLSYMVRRGHLAPKTTN